MRIIVGRIIVASCENILARITMNYLNAEAGLSRVRKSCTDYKCVPIRRTDRTSRPLGFSFHNGRTLYDFLNILFSLIGLSWY
jgi:hypothetical protein